MPRLNEGMQTTAVDGMSREEEVRVLVWRFEQLVAAGYEHEQAIDLAADRDVDLHQAVRILRAGCPARLAVEILL